MYFQVVYINIWDPTGSLRLDDNCNVLPSPTTFFFKNTRFYKRVNFFIFRINESFKVNLYDTQYFLGSIIIS